LIRIQAIIIRLLSNKIIIRILCYQPIKILLLELPSLLSAISGVISTFSESERFPFSVFAKSHCLKLK
jgi:formate hydrogenlyase subunit 4